MKVSFYLLLIFLYSFTTSAQTNSENIPSDSIKLAYELLEERNPKAKGLAERALARAKEKKDYYNTANALNILGSLTASSNYKLSLSYFLEAQENAKISKDSLTISWIYGNTGQLYNDHRKYYLASKQILLSQDYTVQDVDKIINYSTLADIHAILSDLDKAIAYNQKANELAKQIKDSLEIGLSTIKLVSTLIRNKQTKTAKEKLDSIKYYVETNKSKYYDLTNHNYNYALGEYYFALDSLDKALYYINKAKEFRNKNFIIFEPSYFYLLKGKIYFKKNDLKTAEFYFKKGYAVDTVNNKNPIEFYPFLSKIYSKKGNDKKALDYSERYNKLTDSMYAVNNSQKIASLLFDYDRKAVKQKLLLTNKNVALLKANKKKQNLIYLIVLFSLLAIGGSIFYILKQRLNVKKLNLIKAEYNYTKMALITKGEEQEKTRLSKYLHDDITGDLAVIKYALSSINTEIDANTAKEKVQNMSTQLDESISKLRNISHELAPPTLLDFTLLETLSFYCDRLQTKHKNTAIQFETVGNTDAAYATNLATKTTIYRIIQELFSNALAHAKATQLMLLLSMLEDKLIITVKDNGIGYNTNKGNNGLGIKNIEVRVAMLEGTFEVVSNSQGTTTSIEIPKINL